MICCKAASPILQEFNNPRPLGGYARQLLRRGHRAIHASVEKQPLRKGSSSGPARFFGAAHATQSIHVEFELFGANPPRGTVGQTEKDRVQMQRQREPKEPQVEAKRAKRSQYFHEWETVHFAPGTDPLKHKDFVVVTMKITAHGVLSKMCGEILQKSELCYYWIQHHFEQ